MADNPQLQALRVHQRNCEREIKRREGLVFTNDSAKKDNERIITRKKTALAQINREIAVLEKSAKKGAE